MSWSVEPTKRRGICYLWTLQKRIWAKLRNAQWKYRKYNRSPARSFTSITHALIVKPDRNSVVYSLLCSNFSIFTIKFFMVRGIRSLIRPIITPLTFESFFIRVHRHVTPQVGTCCPCIITVVAFKFSNFQMFCVHVLAQLCLDIFIVTVRVFAFNFCMFSFNMII